MNPNEDRMHSGMDTLAKLRLLRPAKPVYSVQLNLDIHHYAVVDQRGVAIMACANPRLALDEARHHHGCTVIDMKTKREVTHNDVLAYEDSHKRHQHPSQIG